MPQRRKGTRILGPYHKGTGWIVVTITEEGARNDRYCKSEDEAHQLIRDAERALELEGPITIGDALAAYHAWQRGRGLRPVSVATTEFRLRSLLGSALPHRLSAMAERARDMYESLCKRRKADTQRNALGEARTFGKWCVKQGYLRQNPWTSIEPIGKRVRGKAQLRVDEARKWLATASELAATGDEGAVAAMMTLLLGLRASEVIERVGRDVDDNGALLWVDRSKTEAGRRVVEVPGLLRKNLVQLASVEGRLFSHDRHWVREQVKRICRRAGVPEVGAHGMRGTMASIAAGAGAATHLVAATLGHVGTAVTLAHYARHDAVAAGTQGRGLAVLEGGKR